MSCRRVPSSSNKRAVIGFTRNRSHRAHPFVADAPPRILVRMMVSGSSSSSSLLFYRVEERGKKKERKKERERNIESKEKRQSIG